MTKLSALATAGLAAASTTSTSTSALDTFHLLSAGHHPVPHHNQARAVTYQTEVTTEWTTVYVTLGDKPTSAAATEERTTLASPAVITAPLSSSSVEVASTTSGPAEEDADVWVEGVDPSPVVPTTTYAYVEPSTTATPSTATAISTTSPSKRGLAYKSATIAKTFISTGSFSWAYNWDCTNDTQYNLGVEYVPMLWGNKGNMIDVWRGCAQNNIDAGATHLLSFNEPDGFEDPNNQAGISAIDAASLHVNNMNPFSGSVKIGAPAITSAVDNTTSSISWLEAFFTACSEVGGCAVDFCPVHWYSSVGQDVDTAVSLLKEFLNKAVATCDGKALWLTEYGLTSGSESNIADFITKSSDMLDSFSGVDRYSYFYVDGTLSTNNTINLLGRTYVSS